MLTLPDHTPLVDNILYKKNVIWDHHGESVSPFVLLAEFHTPTHEEVRQGLQNPFTGKSLRESDDIADILYNYSRPTIDKYNPGNGQVLFTYAIVPERIALKQSHQWCSDQKQGHKQVTEVFAPGHQWASLTYTMVQFHFPYSIHEGLRDTPEISVQNIRDFYKRNYRFTPSESFFEWMGESINAVYTTLRNPEDIAKLVNNSPAIVSRILDEVQKNINEGAKIMQEIALRK